MRITRLRLSGFKSFVDATELRIDTGLTGVVGPNGCGKSNLLEALRWVMGESSPKSMRGSEMEDVIFAGTQARPARSFADVIVSLDNSDRGAPAAFNDSDEIEVVRRIERDAGSAYRINSRDARQRDVQLLFADAATGAHSPALVSQGRIGAIITAKPVDRRAILEEAAGISGLHSRRKEAEQKLRAADANLLRLDDVLAQYETQIGALKRQARQAERYRQLSAELRSVEAMLLFGRWREAAEKLTAAEADLRETDAAVAELTRELARLSAEQATLAAELPDLRRLEAEAAAAVQRLTLARAALDSEAAQVQTNIERLRALITQAASDLQREQAMQIDAAQASERLSAEQTQLQASVQASEAQETGARVRVAEAQALASDGERAFDRLTQLHAEGQARQRAAESQIATLVQQIARLAAEADKLAAEHAAEQQKADSSGAVAAAREAVATAEAAMTTLTAAIADAESAREAAEAIRETALTAQRVAQSTLSQGKAELAGVDRLLAAAAPRGPVTPVLDQIDVASGYEQALAAALSEDLDAAVGQGDRHWPIHAPLTRDDPALPAEATALTAYVKAPAGLGRRLAQIGVIDPKDAQRLVALLKPGQRLVSADGQLWRWDGFYAARPAKAAVGERMTLKNRRDALATKVAIGEAEVAQGEAGAAAAVAAFDAAVLAERAARSQRRDREVAIDQARRSLAAAEQEAARRSNRLDALRDSQRRVGEDRAAREEALAGARHGLAELPDLARLGVELADQRKIVERQRADLASARAEEAALSRRLGAERERLAAIASELAAWHKRADGGAAQAQTLEQRSRDAEAELAVLSLRPAAIEGQRLALLDEIAAAEVTRNEAADRLAFAESAVNAKGQGLKQVSDQLSDVRERRARLDAMVENLGSRRQEFATAIGEQFQCPPAMLPAKLGWDESQTSPPTDALDQQVERLKAERERLGAVNLRADLELEEISALRETSLGEKAELETAIAKLRGSIGSLNREGRQRLLEAFTIVNGHFTHLFKRLFGGGDAHLALVESDDPLEAGLEIMASPPGKKLQYLGLLSGGEQALTAIALIFAVFLTNPAPICVLDEVDAPLDDANVERFCDLLDEMTTTTSTRFLVVTHNAVTMSRMDRLFGVTMAEKGVSQLVSVDLGRAERLLAAE